MSIFIKGLNVPNKYPLKIIINPTGKAFVDYGPYFETREAVDVPAPHGRLIDADKAKEALRRAEALTRAFGYHNVIDTISEAPTIIEAEEGADHE